MKVPRYRNSLDMITKVLLKVASSFIV